MLRGYKYGFFIKLFLKISITFSAIFYVVHTKKLDLEIIWGAVERPTTGLSALFLIFAAAIIASLRWQLLIHSLGVHLPITKIIHYNFIGMFFNTFMPGAVGGDLIKAWYVIKNKPEHQRKVPLIASIITDRLLGLSALVMTSFLALFINWKLAWAIPGLHPILIAIIIVASLIFCFFIYFIFVERAFPLPIKKIRSHKARGALSKIYNAWATYGRQPRPLLQALAYSIATHLCISLAIMLCANTLEASSLPMYQIFLIAPIGLFSTALPITPAGLGVGHIAFEGLFQLVGSPLGAEVFTLYIALQILINLSGIFFYLQAPKPIPEMIKQIQ